MIGFVEFIQLICSGALRSAISEDTKLQILVHLPAFVEQLQYNAGGPRGSEASAEDPGKSEAT